LHQTLESEIDLRPAEAADQSARRLVGQHDTIADRQMANLVSAGHVRVHAVERRRLGCAQIGAAILQLVPGEGSDDAVPIDCSRHGGHPVGRRRGGGEVLEPALDPFDRPLGFARRQSQQHDIGEHGVLGAEAAARMRRRAKAQPIARDTERHCHDRVHRERALEIRGDFVGRLARQVFGDHDKAFERTGGISRVAGGDQDSMRCCGKSRVRVAVAKRAVADDVRADVREEQRRIRSGRFLGVNDRRQWSISDGDALQRILGGVAIARQCHRYGLVDIAHPVDCETPVLHRRLDRDGERPRPAARILSGEDAIDTGQRQRAFHIDREDLCMGMWRAQDRRMQCIPPHRQIVGEAPGAAQQVGILETADVTPRIGHRPVNFGRRF